MLGPLVADAHLGGARSWGLILAAEGIGAVLGGFVMIRFRPRRMLLVASLAVPLPVPVIAATAFLAASFGTSAVLAAGAILVVLLTAAVLLVPEVRNMQRQPVSPESATLTRPGP